MGVTTSKALTLFVPTQPPYPYTTNTDYLRMVGEIVTLCSGVFFFLTNVSFSFRLKHPIRVRRL